MPVPYTAEMLHADIAYGLGPPSYTAHRARPASKVAFDAALAQVPDVSPLPGDEWPPVSGQAQS